MKKSITKETKKEAQYDANNSVDDIINSEVVWIFASCNGRRREFTSEQEHHESDKLFTSTTSSSRHQTNIQATQIQTR